MFRGVICMYDEINSRGLEVFVAILLILGEANIIATTLNKEQGFFTLNVGSNFFEWRKPLVVTSTLPTQISPGSSQTAVTPTEPDSILDNRLVKSNGEADTTSSDIKMILFGIFLLTIFLFEDPFVDTTHSTNT